MQKLPAHIWGCIKMDDLAFNKIKELYVPVFSKASSEEQVNEAKDTFKRLDFKATLRNKVLNYISEYGSFTFFKQEFQSGDVIEFYSRPLQFYNPYLDEFGERVAFIGGYRNCSCSFCGRQTTFFIEAFYMNSAGVIINQNQLQIAGNLDNFWNYLIEKEYDFHPVISDDVYNVLKQAGWYEGRQIDIDTLLEECMEDDVFPTDIQIAFIQEFGGIRGTDLNDMGFLIGNTREDRCYANIAKQPLLTEEKRILNSYGADTLCVGYCNDGEDQIWLSPYGQLIVRQKVLGRTIMEGINCILGY